MFISPTTNISPFFSLETRMGNNVSICMMLHFYDFKSHDALSFHCSFHSKVIVVN